MLLSVREIINTPGKKISFQFSMDLSCVEFGGIAQLRSLLW